MITIPDAMRRPAEVEREELRKQLADARAEIERLDHHRRAGWTEIKRKDKLIGQMREALQYALAEARSTECERLIKAALSAAGRVEV